MNPMIAALTASCLSLGFLSFQTKRRTPYDEYRVPNLTLKMMLFKEISIVVIADR